VLHLREQQLDKILDEIKENQHCFVPDPKMIDTETLEPILSEWNWFEGVLLTAPEYGGSGFWSNDEATAEQVMAIHSWMEQHYGAVAVPVADTGGRRVSKRGVYYTLLSECDPEQRARRDAYLAELQMVADAEYYTRVA
jgi:hypothetical protein